MSKEMTPKEALQIIQDNLTPRTLGILTVEFNIVKQALDRLEALENENKKWREIVGCDLCEALGREILLEENKKLKKAIEFLKEQFEITLDSKLRISDGVDCIQAFPLLMKSNEVIYDLLKEVLEL